MGGLQPSDLLILARPSRHGQDIAGDQPRLQHRQGVARREAARMARSSRSMAASSGFFSLEMSAEQLATRVMPSKPAFTSYKIRQGRITEHEFGRLADVAREIERLPLYIDQTAASRLPACGPCAPPEAAEGARCPVIDYLQLLSASPRRARTGSGVDRNHHQSQGAGEGTECADRGAVAALARGGKP